MNKERCNQMVWSNDKWPIKRRCTKPEWKDGYCKVHHPDSVLARNKASEAKYEASITKHHLHILAERLSTKYDLSKLEEVMEQLKSIERNAPEMGSDWCLAKAQVALSIITRQPAGEKTEL